MANFKPTDKIKLETLFQMKWGYVLDLSNDSLQSFISDSVGVNIYEDIYSKYGDSKAKRLRCFWDIESDVRVGKLILDLLEYYKTIALIKKNKDINYDEPLYLECLEIGNRLSGEKLINKSIEDATKTSIWGNEPCFKVFLSHKSEYRKETSSLKNNLKKFGISCFVAHNDVEPTKEWQKVIEAALFSSDALIALMTDNFFNSNWTNQEIGIAIGRGIFILHIRLGSDPQGFIGQFQALTCDIEKDYRKIVSVLLKYNPGMVHQFIGLVEKSNSWEQSNELALFLPVISELSEPQIHKLIDIYNENNQVCGSFGFDGALIKGKYPCGKGLFYELERITGKNYSDKINFKPLSKIKKELTQINDIITSKN